MTIPNKPSLAEIRANLITEGLKNLPPNSSYINIFVTGRTGSGKTTLGNRLIGEEYFTSTGNQNTTQVVNLIDFSGGIKFFDLPGVDGGDGEEGDRLENYNRVALGLNQFSSYPNIFDITVATYKKNNVPQEYIYRLNEFAKLPFKPDIVFYLINPFRGFSRSEGLYLKDLMKLRYNIIYGLNIELDENNKQKAIRQNIEDAEKKIKKVYSELYIEEEPIIVEINCKTGQGIDSLLQKACVSLGDARDLVFKDVILAQHQKAPQLYIDSIKKWLINIFVNLACYKPTSSENAKDYLNEISKSLWNDFVDFSENLSNSADVEKIKSDVQKIKNSYLDFEEIINHLIKTVINNCQENHYEATLIEFYVPFPKVVYKDVEFYKRIEVWEDDPNQPMFEEETEYTQGGLIDYWTTGKWEKEYRTKKFIGFYKRKVRKKVSDVQENVYNGISIEGYERICLKKYSHSTYRAFGLHGICFLQCLCLAIVNSNFQDKNQFKNLIDSYDSFFKKLTDLNLLDEKQKLSEKELKDLLMSNINLILDQSFDLSAIKTFVERNSPMIENLENTQKSRRGLFVYFSVFLFVFPLVPFFILLLILEKIIPIAKAILPEFLFQCFILISHYLKFFFQILWEDAKYLLGLIIYLLWLILELGKVIWSAVGEAESIWVKALIFFISFMAVILVYKFMLNYGFYKIVIISFALPIILRWLHVLLSIPCLLYKFLLYNLFRGVI